MGASMKNGRGSDFQKFVMIYLITRMIINENRRAMAAAEIVFRLAVGTEVPTAAWTKGMQTGCSP
jgi:hypothetical protein